MASWSFSSLPSSRPYDKQLSRILTLPSGLFFLSLSGSNGTAGGHLRAALIFFFPSHREANVAVHARASSFLEVFPIKQSFFSFLPEYLKRKKAPSFLSLHRHRLPFGFPPHLGREERKTACVGSTSLKVGWNSPPSRGRTIRCCFQVSLLFLGMPHFLPPFLFLRSKGIGKE